MIRRLHSRFVWNSFLLVCIILFVVFLLAGVALVRYVDHSVRNMLDVMLETGDVPQSTESAGFDLAKQLGLLRDAQPTVGGSNLPAYLFEIRQETPDPAARQLSEADQIVCLRGDGSYEEDADLWRKLRNLIKLTALVVRYKIN